MYAVIMASGQGSRLWPLSRQDKPKQFHAIIGKRTLIQETYERLLPKFAVSEIFVTVTRAYLDIAQKQLPEMPKENFIVEPFANDTSTTICLAAKIIGKKDPEAKVTFLPSDHMIADPKNFIDVLSYAEGLLDKYPSNMFLIGINPNRADTSLGYIQMGKQLEAGDDSVAFSVKKFIEKPDLAKAEKYFSSWEFLWNAGMFAFKVDLVLSLYKKFLPNTLKSIEYIVGESNNTSTSKIIDAEYKKIQKLSFDYGITEKAKNIMVIPADFGWSDVGNWGTLLTVLRNNFDSEIVSKGNHISIDDKNTLVIAESKLIATVGLKDTIIVDTPDAILVCNANSSQKIKDLIEKLKNEGKHLYL